MTVLQDKPHSLPHRSRRCRTREKTSKNNAPMTKAITTAAMSKPNAKAAMNTPITNASKRKATTPDFNRGHNFRLASGRLSSTERFPKVIR